MSLTPQLSKLMNSLIILPKQEDMTDTLIFPCLNVAMNFTFPIILTMTLKVMFTMTFYFVHFDEELLGCCARLLCSWRITAESLSIF